MEITQLTPKQIKEAWKTFELRETCENLGLYPNKNGKLFKK